MNNKDLIDWFIDDISNKAKVVSKIKDISGNSLALQIKSKHKARKYCP